jgi:hypothetical protein
MELLRNIIKKTVWFPNTSTSIQTTVAAECDSIQFRSIAIYLCAKETDQNKKNIIIAFFCVVVQELQDPVRRTEQNQTDKATCMSRTHAP